MTNVKMACQPNARLRFGTKKNESYGGQPSLPDLESMACQP